MSVYFNLAEEKLGRVLIYFAKDLLAFAIYNFSWTTNFDEL